jgi:protein RecA
LSLDLALGVGGIPRGRVTEVFGPESSGKTTLMLSVIASAQRAGGLAAFVDVEHAVDPSYAKRIGVNLDDLLISQPDSGEEALTITETLIRSNAVDVIVVDSVAALVPRAELEGQMGDATVGAQARLMSQAMRKLTSCIHKAKTACIFTNQIREKIGDVRQSRDDARRARIEILFQRAYRYAPHQRHQRQRGEGRRQPCAGQGREKQGGPAVLRVRVRHHVRRRHREGRLGH